ncbi:MAG: hypothetical protein AAGD28_12930 [Bacteroidota bacterium]
MLDLVRQLYKEATADLEELEDLWEKVKDYQKEAGVLFAYKAAAKALQAKDSWIPHKKWSYIKEAMAMFREAIETEPENIEMRFLRFTVQHNTPEFLELSDELDEDLECIRKQIHRFADFKLEDKHIAFMLEFLEESKRISEEVLDQIRTRLTQNDT